MIFLDRTDAGQRLAALLERYRGQDVVVLGLPRGGVPVAYEVARALEAPLDVWVSRKLGVPYQPELGMGAIAEGGGLYLNPAVIEAVEATPDELEAVIARERKELERRVQRFRQGRPPPQVKGRTVIVVDDGIATGGTVRAALDALKRLEPAHIVLAVPVAPVESARAFAGDVDEVVAAQTPDLMWSIGGFYQDFRQTSDDEVATLLERARHGDRRGEASSGTSESRPES